MFLSETLPADWEELSKDGPGSDAQASFSREFCAKLAERGWLTQHWPSEYGGRDATPWRHSILGEKYIIVRLLRRDDLPKLRGADTFTKQTIRFGWHLTTIAWWGFAAILFLVAGAPVHVTVSDGILMAIGATFFLSALLSLVLTRARHLSWILFLAIALLCIVELL